MCICLFGCYVFLYSACNDASGTPLTYNQPQAQLDKLAMDPKFDGIPDLFATQYAQSNQTIVSILRELAAAEAASGS